MTLRRTRTVVVLCALATMLTVPPAAHAVSPSTTGSTPSASTITLGGGAVTDTATVTGDVTDGVPTGTVSFHVCGPLASASGCASGGTAVGSAVTLSPGLVDTATATSLDFSPTAAGFWCFRADYSGDGTYDVSTDGSADECFTVSQATPDVASSPATATTTFTAGDSDHVVVTGNSAADSPTGTVSFFVCGPLTSGSGCASGGTPVGTPVTLAGGAGNTASADSPTFTPTAAGTWCFRADYSGDSNYTTSSDGSSGECFTVSMAAPGVVSTPARLTTNFVLGNQDHAVVTGNDAAGSPTGTVSFSACGPLTSASGCASGGTPVGSPVTLTAGAGNAASADSPIFIPTATGIWCFRAAYSGDSNYTASSDGSSGECFTVVQPNQPSATIASPVSGASYALGAVVRASYSCAEAPGGPGIVSCVGSVANGAPIDTTSRGPHGFAVTVRSADGLSNVALARYIVAGPPSVSIQVPQDGATYTRGQQLVPTFSCGEDQFGPGLATCSGPPTVDTASTGTFGFSVTAASTDGQRSTRTVHYNVILPSNRFTISHLRTHRNNGRVTFDITVPGPGAISVMETAPGGALMRPQPGRITYARVHRAVHGASTIHVTVVPNGRGRFLVHHHRFTVRIRLAVTYTPANGIGATHRFSGLRVTR